MELILENKYNQSITLGNYKNEYILSKIDDGSIPVTVNTTKGMTQDGEAYISSQLNKRQIKITIGIKGFTPEKVLNKKRGLQRVLNPKIGLLKMTYGEYTIYATIDNYPKYKEIDSLYYETTINFLCLNPFWSKENLNGGSINTWVKNTEFPIDFIEGYTENLLDGTDFTKTTAFSLLNSGSGTLTQNKADGTITIKNNAATKNGLVTTLVKGGMTQYKEFTFAIDANSTVANVNISIISEDNGQSVEDGLSYGWNCTTINEYFNCRDADGNYLGYSIPIGTKLCVLWCNNAKGLLQVEWKKDGEYSMCWITNDPKCLEYRYKDKFYNNQNASLQLYFGDMTTTAGSLDPYEKATILYKYDGKYCVIYNAGANVLAKTGITNYEGSPGFLNEDNIGILKLGTSNMGRSSVTIIPQHTHKSCRLSITNAVNGSTMVTSKPKLEVGTEANPWNPSFNDVPNQENGIELGYQDPDILKNFINSGDVDTGVVATFKINGIVTGPYIQNVTTGKIIKLKGNLQPGDIIKVDTEAKKVYLTNDKYTNKIDYQYIDNTTYWDFTLITGDNVLKLEADSGKQNVELFVEYKERFVEVF